MAGRAKIALVFPGQGSQKVGMGRAWAEASAAARSAFDEADRALESELSGLCWEGPADALQLTENTQPAILTTSIAIWRAVRDGLPEPTVVAGHSLGEYSALVAARALAFPDAVRLVRERGRLMQAAVAVGEGAMAAILGLDSAAVEAVAAEASDDGVCCAANYNAPGQTVIAGHKPAVERAVELAKERGAKRARLLPVSAPFHSPLMAPARAGLAPLLSGADFADPEVPVMVNVDAAPTSSGATARDALERQVDGPVRWVESIERMRDEFEVDTFVEVGPGKVLAGLIRRIAPDSRTVSLAEPAAFEEFAKEGS